MAQNEGVTTGPLDPAGAAARRQLCCPYCADMLTVAGVLAFPEYDCANCRGRWKIELLGVRVRAART